MSDSPKETILSAFQRWARKRGYNLAHAYTVGEVHFASATTQAIWAGWHLGWEARDER